jgi:hypothetical protein
VIRTTAQEAIASIGAGETPHGELDTVARQHAPGFDFRHVGRFMRVRMWSHPSMTLRSAGEQASCSRA